MAQAAIAGLAKFLVSVGVNAVVAKIASSVFVYAASAYLLSRAAKAMTPKGKNPAPFGAEVSYFDTGAPMRIAYGRVRTGGMETVPAMCSGANNKFLHKVLTLTGHEIDSFNYAHFDTTTIDGGIIGPMAFTASDGMVTSGVYSGHAFVRRYRGTSTDSADRILCDVLSSTFGRSRGIGIGKVALTYAFNDQIFKSVPEATFTYQGKRTYDPRLDASPGADPTNTAFASWNRCPALALADYLMADYGGGYDATEIDWTTVVTAANACDALVTGPPTGDQARYTVNGIIYATDDFQENVKKLVDCMLGRIIFTGGKWRVYAGSWKTPDFVITKPDWTSTGGVDFEQGRKKRFNRMRVWFTDEKRDWQRVESFPRSSPTFLTADKGRTQDAETEQPLCTDQYEAQRKGEFLLRQSRNGVQIAGRLPIRFQSIGIWDTGTIDDDEIGWTSKTFRAVSLDLNEDGSVDAVFAEEQSSDWSDSISYDTQSTAVLPTTNQTFPSEPRNFSAIPQVNGTILFNWDRPIVKPVGTVIEIWRSTNSGDASVGTRIWEGDNAPVPLVSPTSAHWYWGRSRWLQRWSDYSPNTFGVGAIARLEADQTLQQRLCGDAEFEYGVPTSLWEFGCWRQRAFTGFAQQNGTGGARLFNHTYERDTAGDIIFISSYQATGGQFGGFFSVRQNSAAVTSGFQPTAFLVSANPLLPGSGQAHNGLPTLIEYVARVRVNSLPGTAFASDYFSFGIMNIFDSPGSLGVNQFVAQFGVNSSAALRLGEWNTVRGYGVLTPAATPLNGVNSVSAVSVRSATGFYMRGAMRFTGLTNSLGNFDVDFFQATNVGWRNEPTVAGIWQDDYEDVRRLKLFEFMSMCGNVATVLSGTNITFPSSDVFPWMDWRQYMVGRRFSLHKPSTTVPAFICPASGMTLKLAGRAATGTITLVHSLPSFMIIEKTGVTEFTCMATGGGAV